MMLIDSHAHLGMPQFDRDRSEVIHRAAEEGVQFIFTLGTNVDSSEEAVHLAHENPALFAIVGIHPHEAKTLNENCLRRMREVAKDRKVKAYGEIGLDFFRNLSPPDIQITAFRRQIRLAGELDLPVVIHDREAHDETLQILQAEGGKGLSVVFHCFSGDLRMAEKVIDMGFYLSIPGTVTFPKANRIREVIRNIPLERILIETDCPFLSPEPHRGRRNEPSYVRFVAQKIAEIKGIPFETVGTVTSTNAIRFFRIDGEVQ